MATQPNNEDQVFAAHTNSPMLDPAAAGAYLGGDQTPIAVITLAEWRCQKKGPAFVKLGRLVRYRIKDLDAYLTSHVRQGA